jgi:hypothetical protein
MPEGDFTNAAPEPIGLYDTRELRAMAKAMLAPTDATEYRSNSTRRAPYSNVSDATPVVRKPSFAEPKPLTLRTPVRKKTLRKKPKP